MYKKSEIIKMAINTISLLESWFYYLFIYILEIVVICSECEHSSSLNNQVINF